MLQNTFQKSVGQSEKEAATELGFLCYILLAKMSDLDPKVTKHGNHIVCFTLFFVLFLVWECIVTRSVLTAKQGCPWDK